MSGETVITVVGNLTSDPELRFDNRQRRRGLHHRLDPTPVRPRYERVEGRRSAVPALLSLAAASGNAAESLQRGMRVVASGRLRQRSFETRDGEKRTVIELDVEEVGPSLRYATAKDSKSSRGSANGAAAADPWSSAPTVTEPPF